MKTKEEFISRPEDIDLGPTFNAMRKAQRERDWPHYWMHCQSQNSTGFNNYWGGFGYQESLLAALIGNGLLGDR